MKDGRVLKHGKFYRSGGFFYLSEEEKNTFETLHIPYILDLRTKEESDAHPDPEFADTELVRHSGVVTKGGEEIDFSPTGMNQIGEAGYEQLRALTGYYCQMPFENEAFHIFFDRINKDEVPILFHCATGKDRTGVLAMVLLMALGADEETIFNDFMYSCVYRKKYLDEALKENAERIKDHPELEELIVMKEAVSPRIGKAVLTAIKDRYKDYETYVKEEYGYTDESLKAFRDKYLQ